ncbi:MAG: cation diffusion facilitator family transporter [Armatimonadota bacterium]
MDNAARKSNVALLSVISNSTLVIMKLAIGLVIGSVSVISEAIHSGVDLLAAIIALFAVRTSGQPADREHPFGHGKIENISGTVEALLIFLAAGWIIWEAVNKLLHPHPLKSLGWGVGVMLISALANLFVSHMLFKVGRQTDSVALQADAWHLRTDVYTSAGVMTGLALIWLAEAAFPGEHFHWIDPVAAILVAMLIIRAAYELTIKSGRDLLDVSLPDDEEQWIRDYLAKVDSVKGFHCLCTRKAGSERFIEFHLLVDPNMSVQESHRITDEVTQGIREQYEGSAVTIHIEPCDGKCGSDCSQSRECSGRISKD